MNRTYRELRKLKTFLERFRYLDLKGVVGESTFGHDRYLNQQLYRSREWLSVRDQVIIRDAGCDLGVLGHEIYGKLVVHHINPVTSDDLIHGARIVFDLNNLITTSYNTHQAIHFGDESLLPKPFVERRPGDTTPW